MTFVRNNQKEKEPCLTTRWRVGEYVRLSKEDGDKVESDSIQNQKRIIDNHIKYLESQGEQFLSVEVYSDDGYAGGNFDRPDYQRMIRDIEAGHINCVIFKDNSRLGRNYPELGRLMEDYFPEKGVRVISVLNNLDSVKDPRGYCSAIVSFSNIVNDDYIRQLSIKIKSTLNMKRERGEFIGNYAPYGYVKSAEDRHRLEIDPEAAEIVRMIFNWYIEGASASGIVKRLNAMRIMPPSVYKTSKGCKGFSTHSSGGVKQGVWALTTVNSMLRDEVYIGNLIQGKFKSVSYRSKRMVPADESEWIVAEGTHEAIISDEQFTLVHDRLARHPRVSPKRETAYLLSGFIRCAHCGGRMNRHVSNGQVRYRCMTRTYAPEKCRCPSVKEAYLEEILLEVIQAQIQELVDAKAVIDAARAQASAGHSQSEYLRAISKAEREKERLAEAKFRLYDRYQAGALSQEEYTDFRQRYDAQIAAQNDAILTLQTSLTDLRQAREQDDAFVAYFERRGNLQAIDRTVLEQLLDYVEFQDAEHIRIHMKYSPEREKLLSFARELRADPHACAGP